MDEIMELFPSRYIHIGGDEAQKTHWKKCPLCQTRMKKEGLANEEDLQGYFMQRISDYVRSKGREVIGWDELTNSSFLPEGSIILGWQGYGKAALKAAGKGTPFHYDSGTYHVSDSLSRPAMVRTFDIFRQ